MSLILAVIGVLPLCLASFAIGPRGPILLSLPSGALGLGAVVLGVIGLRRPVRRWAAVVGLLLGLVVLIGALCTLAAAGAVAGLQGR
ncbi:hypothetical protein QYE77_14500 [Thermanaerothrix sp. 4228-RoL]|uniref:Uncharacterized protein n=1 Tax=Thermanaerothrix solaris TaxID=3058434 RepID=A0ABU3NRM6_9CHLR|nr:hypothetical protein [Thermanaerothrix sp. 4228-RoL]MDT8899472.1 hypothetical protein [Thermanaerothrix sp. 4228-RoL]